MHYQKPQDPSIAALARLSAAHQSLEQAVNRVACLQQIAIEKKRLCNEEQFAERLVQAQLNSAGCIESRKNARIAGIQLELSRSRLELISATLALAEARNTAERVQNDLENCIRDRYSLISSGTEDSYIASQRLLAHCLLLCAGATVKQSSAWLSQNPCNRETSNAFVAYYNSMAWPYQVQNDAFPTSQFQLTFIECLTGGERLERAYKNVLEIRPRMREKLAQVAKMKSAATAVYEEMRSSLLPSERQGSNPAVMAKVEYARLLLAAFHLSFEVTAALHEMKEAAQEIVSRIGMPEYKCSPFFDMMKNNCLVACQLFNEVYHGDERYQTSQLGWQPVNKDAVETLRSVLDVVEIGCTMDGFTRPDPAQTRKVKSPAWRPEHPEYWLVPPAPASTSTDNAEAENKQSLR